MAGSIPLYGQPQGGALVNYQTGTFETTDLVKNEDYTEQFLKLVNVSSIDKNCYFLKIQLTSQAAIDHLDMAGATDIFPIPAYMQYTVGEEEQQTTYFAPENCNLEAQEITSRPLDWDIHWRDKYNAFKQDNTVIIPHRDIDNKMCYFTQTIDAPTSGGIPSEATWSASNPSYAENNQGRKIFWTMSDCYFGIEAGWQFAYPVVPEIRCFVRGFYCGANPSDPADTNTKLYVNAIRERGMLGNYVPLGNSDDFVNFSGGYHKTYTTPQQVAAPLRVQFVQFSYPIELEGGEVIQEEMTGICYYEISPDGYIQGAVINGISTTFWEGVPRPPYTGPTSNVQGGGGRFMRNSESDGDLNGNSVGNIVSNWNSGIASATEGYNKYVIKPGHSGQSALTTFVRRISNPSLWDGFTMKYANPISSVIQYHLMPANLAPSPSATSKKISAAGLDWSEDYYAPLFGNDYISYHVGTWSIEEDSESFADYNNTSVILYLPYVGVYTLDISSCMGGAIAVDYASDAWSGDCVAIVTVQDRFGNLWKRYSWKGNCAKQLPLYSYTPLGTRIASAVGGAALGVAGGLAAGALGGLATGSVAGAAIGESRVSKALGDVVIGENGWTQEAYNRSSNFIMNNAISQGRRVGTVSGAANGFATGINSIGSNFSSGLGVSSTVSANASGGAVSAPIDSSCWLLIVRPEWSNPEYYGRECAYTSDIEGTVGKFEGLLICSSVELDGIDCTDYEKAEIAQALRSGVYTT